MGGDLNLPHEVLEAILSHLPTLDLIVATGVNKTLRTIVKNSPTLQRNLFLRPTNKPREFVKVEDGYKFAVATQKEFDGLVEDDDIEYYYNRGGSNAPPRVLAYEDGGREASMVTCQGTRRTRQSTLSLQNLKNGGQAKSGVA
jgi:hypothetical protein